VRSARRSRLAARRWDQAAEALPPRLSAADVRACREEAEREAGIYHPEVIEVPDGWHTHELVPGPVPAGFDGARPRLKRHVVWHLSPEFAGTGRPETVGMPRDMLGSYRGAGTSPTYAPGGVIPGARRESGDYYISPPSKPCPLSSLERRYLAALKTPPAVLGPPATFEEQVAAIRPEDAWRASGRVSMS
jgi:hypothetical protein